MDNSHYLIIDTSTKNGLVGIYAEGEIKRTYAWNSKNNHTAELMPAIKMMMDFEGIGISSFQGIVVTVGPGGFSAIRTGLAVGKGLALGASLPIVGVNSLETSAYSNRFLRKYICSVIPAGRENVAWCTYTVDSLGWHSVTQEKITKISEFVTSHISIEDICFCGEGFTRDILEQLEAHYQTKIFYTDEISVLARLNGAISIGLEKLRGYSKESSEEIQPIYLRPPSIT